MIDEIEGCVRAVSKDEISRMYKNRVGQFVSYADENTDKRKIDLNLFDIENTDIPQTQLIKDVPLAYFGSKAGVDDFELEEGDELLVFFCDRSTDLWRENSGTSPNIITRSDQHSIDYALAIPIVTFHNKDFKPETGIKQFKVKEGNKIQIGTDSAELLSLMHQTLTTFDSLLTKLQGNVDSVGTSSTGTLSLILTDLVQFQTDNQTALTSLETITEI